MVPECPGRISRKMVPKTTLQTPCKWDSKWRPSLRNPSLPVCASGQEANALEQLHRPVMCRPYLQKKN